MTEEASAEVQEVPCVEREVEVGVEEGGIAGCSACQCMAIVELHGEPINFARSTCLLYLHVCVGSITLPCLKGLKSSFRDTTPFFFMCFPKNGLGVVGA